MDDRRDERFAMVLDQIAARGISTPAVLEALESVPRHLFVPEALRSDAYADRALSIGDGQTISQPYIVAAMMELSGIAAATGAAGRRLLDIGTGSGYGAAVALQLGAEVWSVECAEDLAYQSRARLMRCGYGGVRVRHGDGRFGWPESAPFDAILVAAACELPPAALVAQLAPNGRMVIPLGPPSGQYLSVVTKSWREHQITSGEPVRFVPLVEPSAEASSGSRGK